MVDALVLLVDDFEDSRAMYAEYLTLSGYRVIQAADGREALARTRELAPDLIVMDLALPGMDGWAATRALKSDPRTREVRIIALTGHAGARDAARAHEVGCDALLLKPCMPSVLLETVRRLLGQG